MLCGTDLAIESCRKASFFRRGSSDSGNSGCSATSATRAAARGPNSLSTSVFTLLSSTPTVMSIAPPMRADSSAISFELLLVVPSFINLPVKSARPGMSAGSFRLPVRNTRLSVTFGKFPYGTSVTFIPFGNSYVSCAGTVNGLGGPPAGGVCFCCAKQGPAQSAKLATNAAVTAANLFMFSSRFMSALLIFCRRGRRFARLRLQHQHRAILWPQIFLRRFLDQLRCNFFEFSNQRVDAGGIVIEQGKACQQVRQAKSADLSHAVVKVGAQFHARAIQGFFGHWFGPQSFDWIVPRLDSRVRRSPRISLEVRHEQHRTFVVEHVAQIIDSAFDFRRQSFFLHQLLIFQAVVAFNQDLIDQAHGVILRCVAIRHVISDRNRWTLR